MKIITFHNNGTKKQLVAPHFDENVQPKLYKHSQGYTLYFVDEWDMDASDLETYLAGSVVLRPSRYEAEATVIVGDTADRVRAEEFFYTCEGRPQARKDDMELASFKTCDEFVAPTGYDATAHFVLPSDEWLYYGDLVSEEEAEIIGCDDEDLEALVSAVSSLPVKTREEAKAILMHAVTMSGQYEVAINIKWLRENLPDLDLEPLWRQHCVPYPLATYCWLDKYEHSGVSYYPSGTGIHCRWDSTSHAGVWLAPDWARKELEEGTKEDPEEYIAELRRYACELLSGHTMYAVMDVDYTEDEITPACYCHLSSPISYSELNADILQSYINEEQQPLTIEITTH